MLELSVYQIQAEKFEFQGNDVFEHCVLPEGKFYEKDFFGGSLKIGYTKENLLQMVDNFEKGRLHFDPIVCERHGGDKVGEVIGISYKDTDQPGLYAKMQLDEDGLSLMRKKKYKYMSAEVIHNHVDDEGKDLGFAFMGVALTNYPRHKFIRKLFSIKGEGDVMVEQLPTPVSENFELKYQELSQKYESVVSELEATKKMLFDSQLSSWKSEKLLQGFTPAPVEKFSKFYGKMSVEELNELLGDAPKQDDMLKQVYQKEEFVHEEEGLAAKAIKDYKRMMSKNKEA